MSSLDIRALALKHLEKLKKIKVCLFDIDNVLTDGRIHYDGEEMGFNRSTHALDGYGLKVLMQAGLKVGVISGGISVGMQKRFEENLKLDYVFLGNEDKRSAFKKILADGFTPDQVLYMGDEFFDLPLLMAAGFSVSVKNASHEVQERVDYIAHRNPGEGCVREVVDMVRYAQGIYPEVLDIEGKPIPFK